jgi:mercuric ion transport protein
VEANHTTSHRSSLGSYLSLFTSVGTLLCCALPSLLVLLGLGATVASFLSAAPWLVTLSQHKSWVFAIAGVLIGGNLGYLYIAAPKLQRAGVSCPADAPDACATASRASRVILWISAGLYGVGLFSAYALGPLLIRFG